MWQVPHLASPPHLWVNFSPEAMMASRIVEPSAASMVLPDGMSVTIGISLLHMFKTFGKVSFPLGPTLRTSDMLPALWAESVGPSPGIIRRRGLMQSLNQHEKKVIKPVCYA